MLRAALGSKKTGSVPGSEIALDSERHIPPDKQGEVEALDTAAIVADATKMFLDKKTKFPVQRSEEKSTVLTEHILEILVIGKVMINPSNASITNWQADTAVNVLTEHGADINSFGKVVNHSIDTAALVADARFCEQTASDNILEMETALIVPGEKAKNRFFKYT